MDILDHRGKKKDSWLLEPIFPGQENIKCLKMRTSVFRVAIQWGVDTCSVRTLTGRWEKPQCSGQEGSDTSRHPWRKGPPPAGSKAAGESPLGARA